MKHSGRKGGAEGLEGAILCLLYLIYATDASLQLTYVRIKAGCLRASPQFH